MTRHMNILKHFCGSTSVHINEIKGSLYFCAGTNDIFKNKVFTSIQYELRREKTGLRDFQTGLTEIRLNSLGNRLKD